jgi:Integrase core domain/Amidohydrolase family
VKLGILVSPRTVRAYWPQERDPRGGRRTGSQHWRTFVRNHAKAIATADFLVAITAGFRVLYVFVVMEVGSRRILHCNVTAHPTAAWAVQQFREAIPSDHIYRFLIHDRDSIFSPEVDDDLGAFGLRVLRTPVQAPEANAYCERLMGTIRRECLDYVIPLSEKHLRTIMREWVAHYNQGRPHASLGPGIPDSDSRPRPRPSIHGHELPANCRIRARDVLGGLHHEYWLEEIAASGRIDFLRSAGSSSWAKQDVNGTQVQEIIRNLVSHHVAVTSTLPVYEAGAPGRPVLQPRTLNAMSAESAQSYLIARARVPLDSPRTALLRKEMDFEVAFVKAGGLLLAGPDPTGNGGVLPGFGDQREIELLVEAGFTPVEAIQIATENGALYLGQQDRIGTLAPGKQADLVLIKGDPSKRIDEIENVETVFKGGSATTLRS